MLAPERAAKELAALEGAYRQRGWEGFARRELELADEERQRPRTVWRIGRSGRHGGGGASTRASANRDRALAFLEAAYAQRHGNLVCVKADPRFDSLHADPRFQDLVRRVGIPP